LWLASSRVAPPLFAHQRAPVDLDLGHAAADLAIDQDAVELASSSTSVEWAAVARRPCSSRTGISPRRSAAPPQLTMIRWAWCEFEGQGRGAAGARVLGQRRRGGIELQHALARG
jgi:hypothetical protein